MTWVRIDDGFDEHPKHAAAGPLCWALWVAGLAYCNRNLTDGFIPFSKVPSLVNWKFLEPPGEDGRRRLITVGITCGAQGDDVTSEYVACLLVAHGIWEERENGYYIHDYPDYQPTKKEVLRARKQTERRTHLGGLARARTAQREEGRYVKHQQQPQQDGQQQCWSVAGPVLVDAHQQEHHLTSSPGPVPVPVPVPVLSTKITDAVADLPEAGSLDNSDMDAPKEPEAPTPAQPAPSGPTTGDRGKKPKALKEAMSEEQAVRAKLLCEAIEHLPAKVRKFPPWMFLQKCSSGGLPIDEALKILCRIKDRWAEIRGDAWPYAQVILDRDYQSYRIRLELEAHEQRKREPANVGAILRNMISGGGK